MKNSWPTTVEELVEECERLEGRYDLYTLGERGEPLLGESEPRIDGTDYLAGEYQYGVAMIPAQWVTHVLSAPAEPDAATAGVGTCKNIGDGTFVCSECGAHVQITDIGRSYLDENGKRWYSTSNEHKFRHCPNCGKRIEEDE